MEIKSFYYIKSHYIWWEYGSKNRCKRKDCDNSKTKILAKHRYNAVNPTIIHEAYHTLVYISIEEENVNARNNTHDAAVS